jgi:rhombotail lipoprotein
MLLNFAVSVMSSIRPFIFCTRPALLTALVGAFFFAGCSYWPGQRAHRASSVVSFLYPAENQPLVMPTTPELQLPLRVGLAFVPSTERQTEGFTAMQKQLLLQNIAAGFRALPFVQSIEVVPESYLRPAGGFANLDQLRGLLGIDVIVLVGYDQAQFTEDNGCSFAYWTIVGAYFVHGNRNDTHTLMEASVYDIRSRALLFRAPGSNQTKASVELINVGRKLRDDSGRSFAAATADLTANLHTELEVFKQRVKEGKADAKIVSRPGYTGGGALSLTSAGALLALLAAALGTTRLNRNSAFPQGQTR